jgi:hypothetical protein|tara:strand:+ start:487 stop:954 length:468 start_codon:yes stop_codon:yes gene_type:complete
MTAAELREKIKVLAKQVYADIEKANEAAIAYPEIQKFPPLREIIVNLLTNEFDSFIESIDWVAPRPTTFRINLLNGENFLLMYTIKSWIGQVSGKKYYLLNLDEEERCALAINRLLRVGPASGAEVEGETDAGAEADTGETEVEDEVDVNVDVEA